MGWNDHLMVGPGYEHLYDSPAEMEQVTQAHLERLRKENATRRLEMAAPDLLQAAKAHLEAWDSKFGAYDHQKLKAARLMAEQAIVKAEGEAK